MILTTTSNGIPLAQDLPLRMAGEKLGWATTCGYNVSSELGHSDSYPLAALRMQLAYP